MRFRSVPLCENAFLLRQVVLLQRTSFPLRKMLAITILAVGVGGVGEGNHSRGGGEGKCLDTFQDALFGMANALQI